MWKQFSLRQRLSLSLAAMLWAVFTAGAIALIGFSSEQLSSEYNIGVRSVARAAAALNSLLEQSNEPVRALAAYAAVLPAKGTESIRYLPAAERQDPAIPHPEAPGVPNWFTRLILADTMVHRFPVEIRGEVVGSIVYVPDLSADISEKWFAFIGLLGGGLLVVVGLSLVCFYVAGGILAPLQALETKLSAAVEGQYGTAPLVHSGPPEVGRAMVHLNELTERLKEFQSENRVLLRRLVSIQDEERADLSRELHDELGPQLFAVRAIGAAIANASAAERESLVQQLLTAIQAVQEASHNVLDRLRPMHLQELGLRRSIEGIMRDAQAKAPNLSVKLDVANDVEQAEIMVALTLYRLVQEAVTNVLRHAQARALSVSMKNDDRAIILIVSDDGVGFDGELVPGRGLRGMRERAQALGGSLEVDRHEGVTRVVCRLPNSAAQDQRVG